MRVKIGNREIRFRKRQSPKIVIKLSTLSVNERIEIGFRNYDEFLKWLNS